MTSANCAGTALRCARTWAAWRAASHSRRVTVSSRAARKIRPKVCIFGYMGPRACDTMRVEEFRNRSAIVRRQPGNKPATTAKIIMAQDPDALIWIDMEMSGLNPETDRVLEIAIVITDAQLNVVAEAPVLVVH